MARSPVDVVEPPDEVLRGPHAVRDEASIRLQQLPLSTNIHALLSGELAQLLLGGHRVTGTHLSEPCGGRSIFVQPLSPH